MSLRKICHKWSNWPVSRRFPATTMADRGGGGLEQKEGNVVVPTGPVPLSLEVCGGDGGSAKLLRWR
ncbi:unnamed protein product [Prunus armeniaca]